MREWFFYIIVNVDYQRLFETQFELKQGERFCRNVTIINDRMVEGREFFLVVLEDLRWGEIIETLAIVIEDEDCKIIIISLVLKTITDGFMFMVVLLNFCFTM